MEPKKTKVSKKKVVETKVEPAVAQPAETNPEFVKGDGVKITEQSHVEATKVVNTPFTHTPEVKKALYYHGKLVTAVTNVVLSGRIYKEVVAEGSAFRMLPEEFTRDVKPQ